GASVEFEPAGSRLADGGPADGRFTAELQVPGPEVNGTELKRLHGRYLVANGLVISAIALAAERSAGRS
ncbi:MAG TPA: hypothetical protein VFU36_18570, partial [Jatrophihabitans sp.]|nr:hypothetical protein [Jatrophihabitans sp.]